MKKYFININNKQSEPLSLEELKEFSIKKNTLVWYKGLTNWEEAGKLDELNELWQTIDETQDTDYEEPRNYSNYWFGGIALVLSILIGVWYYFRPNEVQIANMNSPSKSDTVRKQEIIALEKGCFHTDLSKKYNFQIIRNISNKYEDGVEKNLFIISVIIYDKKTSEKVDVINFISSNLYSDVFDECDNIRSFLTGNNKDNDVVDGDWGDFVVADFNFDSRDDFAMKYHSGGNVGSIYVFYLQDTSKKFIRDREHIGIEYRLNLKTY